MDDDAECYVICHCSTCDGRSWYDFDEIVAHLGEIRDTDFFELELIDVGLN